MPSDWAEVDTLIRELGAVRVAADAARASATAKAAIERALADAAEAIGLTIDSPRNPATLSQAQQSIASARELVAALTAEIERAQRARGRAAALGVPRPLAREGETG
jgi:hypothetical protein